MLLLGLRDSEKSGQFQRKPITWLKSARKTGLETMSERFLWPFLKKIRSSCSLLFPLLPSLFTLSAGGEMPDWARPARDFDGWLRLCTIQQRTGLAKISLIFFKNPSGDGWWRIVTGWSKSDRNTDGFWSFATENRRQYDGLWRICDGRLTDLEKKMTDFTWF